MSSSEEVVPGSPYPEMRETHYSDRNESIAYGREVVDDEFVRMRLVRTSWVARR